jgi:hypothetical protein
MINIKKLIKIVKEGYSNPFNLNKKAQGSEGADEQVMPMPSTIPIQQEIPVQQEKVEKAPIPEAISPESEYKMDVWVKENREEIKMEATLGILDLVNKKNNSPKDSNIGADPSLYQDLISNTALQPLLSQKIIDLGVEKPKADLLVETLLVKTKDQRIVDVDAPAVEEEIGTPAVEEQVEQQAADGRDDIPTEVQVAFLPGTLGEAKVKDIFQYFNRDNMYSEGQLSLAIAKAFPDDSKVDPVFKFFLINPQKFEGVLSSDVNFSAELANTIKNRYGIWGGDIFQSLKKVYDLGANGQKSVAEILNSNDVIREGIYNRFLEMVADKDLSILEWLYPWKMKEDVQRGRAIPSSQVKQKDPGGKGLDIVNLGTETSEVSMEKAREAEETAKLNAGKQKFIQDAQDKVSSLTRQYLQPKLEQMQQIGEDIFNSYNDKAAQEIRGKKVTVSRLKSISNTQDLNAFFSQVKYQLDNLFQHYGHASIINDVGEKGEEEQKIKYTNNYGQITIPWNILNNVYGDEIHKRYDIKGGLKIDDYKEAVDKYRAKVESGEVDNPYDPNWKKMVNMRLAHQSQVDLGMISEQIHNYYKATSGMESELDKHKYVMDKINRGKDSRFIFDKLSGMPHKKVIDDKGNTDWQRLPDPLEFQKKSNLITIIKKLGPETKSIDTYLKQKKIDEKITKLKAIPQRSPAQEEQLKEAKEENKKFKKVTVDNAKGFIGLKLNSLLPDLVKQVEQEGASKEIKESVSSIVDLFDHYQGYKDFSKNTGQVMNDNDPYGRTNTELYYIAKGKKAPMASLFRLREEGILANDKWWRTLFRAYDEFNKKDRFVNKLEHGGDDFYISLKDIVNGKDLFVNNEVIPKAQEKIKELSADKSGKSWRKVLDKIPPESLLKFDNEYDLAQWFKEYVNELVIGTKDADPAYLKLIGLKRLSSNLNKKLEKVEIREEAIAKAQLESDNEFGKLQKMVLDKGINLDLSALKITHSIYKIMMKKVAKLEKIKKSGYKFASVDISSIDAIIYKTKADCYNLLSKILR